MRQITGDTIVTGIVGYPVRYSLSPLFQNYLFEKYNLNYVYLPFPVENPDLLETAIRGLIASGVRGLNITIPYKERAMKIADWSDQLSKFVKATNTIVAGEKGIKAYNTDGPGFWDAMEKRFEMEYGEIKLYILGSGGAARGIIGEGVKRGIKKITIFARHEEKGKSIINDLHEWTTVESEVRIWDEIIRYSFPPFSVIVNTTPLGMKGETIPLGWNFEDKNSSIIADIVYKPVDTPLLIEAKKRGFRIFPGYLMLAGQGILSFKLWTGILPSFEETAEFIRSLL